MFHILLSLLLDSLGTEFQVENDSPVKPLKALIRVCLCSLGLLVRNLYQQIINLFLGRKVMTNVDSILKSRDVTLPTKVHLVKAIVFQ